MLNHVSEAESAPAAGAKIRQFVDSFLCGHAILTKTLHASTTMAVVNEPPPVVRPPRHQVWLSLVCFFVGLVASSTFHSLPATLTEDKSTADQLPWISCNKADALARENEALRAAAVSAAAATVAAVAAARKEAGSSLFLPVVTPPPNRSSLTPAQTGVKAVAAATDSAAELAVRLGHPLMPGLRGDAARLPEEKAGHPAVAKCSTACAPWDDVGLGPQRWWPLPTRLPTGTTLSTSKLSHQAVQSLAGWWEYRTPHRRQDAPPLTPPLTSSVAPGTPSTPSASVSTSVCAGNFGSKWPSVAPMHTCDAKRPT